MLSLKGSVTDSVEFKSRSGEVVQRKDYMGETRSPVPPPHPVCLGEYENEEAVERAAGVAVFSDPGLGKGQEVESLHGGIS